MRTLAWLVAILLNVAAAVAFAAPAFDEGVTAMERLGLVALATLFLAITTLLVLARFSRLPRWGDRATRYLCASLPVLWLVGSLDGGVLSGQEAWSVLLISLFAWGTWRAFRLLQPQA